MQAGPLRHRITIQSLQSSLTPFSPGAGDTWLDVIKLWASVVPLTSKETFQAGQVAMKVSHKITIRYPGSTLISAGNRVCFGKRRFELQSGIVNPDERNIMLELLAFEIDPTL